jgi:lysophospholipase L1-like esterase
MKIQIDRKKWIFTGITITVVPLVILCFFLGLAEAGLRLFYPQVFPVHPEGMYQIDQAAGYVLTPGYQGNIKRVEYDFIFHINDQGLRTRVNDLQSDSVRRVLLLGDSQAFGFGVGDDETVAVLLENSLKRHYGEGVMVQNAGVPGYGTVDQLNFLRSRIGALRPDLVIVQFLPVNDFDENRAPAKDRVAIRDGMLVSKNPASEDTELSWLKRIQYFLKARSHLYRLLSDHTGYAMMKAGLLSNMDQLWGEDFSDKDSKITIEALSEIASIAKENGAKSLFLYTTAQAQIIADGESDPPRSFHVLQEASERSGTLLINTVPKLQTHPERMQLYYPLDGHWTATGHRVISDILTETIISEKLLEENTGI